MIMTIEGTLSFPFVKEKKFLDRRRRRLKPIGINTIQEDRKTNTFSSNT